jgi:hypothetical protein
MFTFKKNHSPYIKLILIKLKFDNCSPCGERTILESKKNESETTKHNQQRRETLI